MKRAVLCVPNPQDYIPLLNDYSLMIVNPATPESRMNYLLDNADWSLLVTPTAEQTRNGGNYENEKVLWYTSGTTGDSKFRSFSQDQLRTLGKTICDSYNITNNDRYLSIMPLWHAHGQGMYWAMQHAQCEVEYINSSALKTEIDFDPTFISAIPDFLRVFMRQKFKNLRFVRSASAALPDQLFVDLKSWSNAPVIEAFGMTETCSHCITNPLEGEQRIGTVGLPSGAEVMLEDGIMYIKGPCVFQPGWYNTGDYAEQDEKGYYKVLGRVTDRLNIKGYKIDPVSVENQLYNMLPGLSEIVVFGEDRVMCVYTGDVDLADVKQALINVDPHCHPRVLQHLQDIPKNNAGKVSRSMLKGIYK